jgi:hypothetical protein
LFASVFSFISIYNSHLEKTVEIYQEAETLKSYENLTSQQEIRLKTIEDLQVVLTSNKEFYMSSIGVIFTISIFLIAFGFYQWEKVIQPLQDTLLMNQALKSDLEIKVLKKTLNKPSFKK